MTKCYALHNKRNKKAIETKKKTYQVCADGKRSVDRSSRWIWNFCVPFIPSSAPNPCNGTFDVPVTNCKNLARSAWSKLRNARQNHWIYKKFCSKLIFSFIDFARIHFHCSNWFNELTCIEFAWYLWYSVLAFRSSISTLGRPEINNSSSCSLNIEMSLFGMLS